ncbi:MAG: T9SS C-terminal target domain-containing protein [Saprospirales bacterium]|nr:MAG: T9SS C-terminal target domain-containing protein [Saprospirales bacterium]
MRHLNYFASAVFIILLSLPTINAQIEWTYVYDKNTRTSINSVFLTENDQILMNLNYGLSCPNNRIVAFNLEGNHEWTFSESYSSLGANLRLVKSFDGAIYSVGFHGEEDYVSGEEHLSIHKINFEGDVEMKKDIPWNLNQFDHMIPCGFDWHKEWGFIVVDCFFGNLVRLDQEANLLEVIALGEKTNDVIFVEQDRFIIIQNEIISLIDATGQIINNHSLSSKIQSSGKKDESFYFISKDSIFIFDENLNHVKAVSHDPNYTVISTQLIGDEFYSLSKKNDSVFIHTLENEAWSITHTSPIVFNPSDFLISDDLVIIAGNVGGQMAMYAINKNSSDLNYFFPDLELLDVELIDLVLNTTNIPVYDEDVIESLSFTPGLWLKNKGQFPIYSFGLHANQPGGFNCAIPHYYRFHENVVIEPGETKFIEAQRYSTHGDHRMNLEICFSLKAPNADIEIIRSNNSHCVDITISAIDKADEPIHNIQIYPNPVADWLVIDMSSANFSESKITLTVTDMLGKEVFRSSLPTGIKEKIDVSKLANGIYIVKFHQNGAPIEKHIFVKN